MQEITAVFKEPKLSSYLDAVASRVRKAAAPQSPSLQRGLDILLGTPGKQLRPMLVYAVAGADNYEAAITGGAAIELLHISSIVHDDIIDHTAIRRGQATVGAQEGDSQAILAGDYLVGCASQQAASLSAESASLIATGLQKLCDGQSLELSDDHNPNRTVQNYMAAIQGKTGALFAASCQLGGLLAGLSAPKIAALQKYGDHFGMMFQIVDDVLDFLAAPDRLGKPVGQDVREGNYTLPLLLALEGGDAARARQLLDDADLVKLIDFLFAEQAFQNAIDIARQEAVRATSLARTHSFVPSLAALPEAYLRQSLTRYLDPAYRNRIDFTV